MQYEIRYQSNTREESPLSTPLHGWAAMYRLKGTGLVVPANNIAHAHAQFLACGYYGIKWEDFEMIKAKSQIKSACVCGRKFTVAVEQLHNTKCCCGSNIVPIEEYVQIVKASCYGR